MWEKVITVYQDYAGSGFVLGMYFLSVVYLFVTEKKKNTRIYFLYVPLGVLLLFFNPLAAKIIYSFVGDEIYYRMLWMLPIVVTIAYAAVELLKSLSGKVRMVTGVAIVCLMMLGGKFIYQNSYFSVAENVYHVPDAVVHICDAIKVEGREVMAAFPREMVQYVRQYEPSVCMPYGREMMVEDWIGWHVYELYQEMNADTYDAGRIAELAKERSCHYVILWEEKEIIGEFEDYDYELFAVIDGYRIYRDTTVYIGL